MPYHAFLSHNSQDKELVRAMKKWLEDHGVECFLDEHELLPGDRLPAKLGKAMEESSAAVICIGPNGEGRWQSEEIDSLLSKATDLSCRNDEFRLIPILFPGADTSKLRRFLKTRIWVDLSRGITDNEAELFRLRNAIMGRAEDSSLQTDPTVNPYRGLEAFRREDAPFFFGRAQQCRDLAVMVKEWRFACIVGPSGNGKSSLARAGLATDAAESACLGISSWRRVFATPGSDFVRSILVQLSATLPEAERAGAVDAAFKRVMPDTSRATAASLAEALDNELKATLPDVQPILIVIDQFEEVFTHRGLVTPDEETRQERIRLVLDALALIAARGAKRWHFVFTLRSDFYQRCRLSETFWTTVSAERHSLHLDELDEEGWRAAIKGPAARAGAYLEAGLVQTMLKDVYRQRGSMPLLQLALDQLWRLHQGACLTHAALVRGGGRPAGGPAHAA